MLGLVHKDYDLSFDGLLEKDGSITICHCIVQTSAIEMFNSFMTEAPIISRPVLCFALQFNGLVSI